MSAYSTLHIATENPLSLPEERQVIACFDRLKKYYSKKYSWGFQLSADDIVLKVYKGIVPVERAEVWNTNDKYISEMPSIYCPTCQSDLKAWLFQVNQELAQRIRHSQTYPNQALIPFELSEEDRALFRCQCKEQNPNQLAQYLLFGRFEIIDSLYNPKNELSNDYDLLLKDLEQILGEKILTKKQVS